MIRAATWFSGTGLNAMQAADHLSRRVLHRQSSLVPHPCSLQVNTCGKRDDRSTTLTLTTAEALMDYID
jgi:hypothetical protein